MDKIKEKIVSIIHNGLYVLFKAFNYVGLHIKLVITLVFFVAFLFGWFGVNEAFEAAKEKKIEHSDALALLLAFENLFVQIPGEYSNLKVVFAQFLAYIALLMTVVVSLFKDFIVSKKLNFLSKVKHILVVGLGENNRMYLQSEIESGNEKSVIIIESDINNVHAKYFKEKGFGVFYGTLDEYTVNFRNLDRVVISAGNDRTNIEIASKLISKIPTNMDVKSFGECTIVNLHIENQDYNVLFQQNILNNRTDLPIEFKPYSFNDDAVRNLFDKHTILGNFHTLAQTAEPYNIIVLGDGDLAKQVVYHLCMQSQLPNENPLTIHCVNSSTQSFIAKLESSFPNISRVKNVSLEEHTLSIHDPEFYKAKVWTLDNLTNIYICNDDEDINLERVVSLHEKVYLREAVLKQMKIKVHFAMYHNMQLSETIDQDTEKFKNYFSFGNASNICSREFFIDEKYENIAKLIHKGYGDIYNEANLSDFNDDTFLKDIEEKWLNKTKFSDRESNRSQALHINTKLMAMGLKKVKYVDRNSNKSDQQKRRELFEMNTKMFESFCEELDVTKEELIEVSSELPKMYVDKEEEKKELDETLIENFYVKIMKDKSLIAKLMQSEHERWNAFHHLNGWEYQKKKNKDAKAHNCLTSLDQFDNIERKLTLVYDLYSVLYIPNYLASTGYRIVPIEDVSIGMFNCTKNGILKESSKKILKCDLENIVSKYGNIKIVSSLHDDLSHQVVDIIAEIDAQKIKELNVVMPFKYEDYIKDFVELSSRIKFNHYLRSIIANHSLTYKVTKFPLTNESRYKKRELSQSEFDDDQYEKVQKEIEKRSDEFLDLKKYLTDEVNSSDSLESRSDKA